LLLCVKSELPAIEKLPLLNGASPLLANVTVWDADGVPTRWLPNAIAFGVRTATGAIPVPPRLIVGTGGMELLWMARAPERPNLAVGVNVTLTEQFAPAASVVPQLLVWLKSPVVAMAPMARAIFPELISITVCAALEVWTS